MKEELLKQGKYFFLSNQEDYSPMKSIQFLAKLSFSSLFGVLFHQQIMSKKCKESRFDIHLTMDINNLINYFGYFQSVWLLNRRNK